MTEDELDLLASAYADGEATSEEVALVEGEPELMARVSQLRAVSEQLSAVPPIDAAVKQQHLAAAMAEFSNLGATGGTPASQAATDGVAGPSTTSSVPSLAEKRRNREARKAQRSMPQWLSAAAAFVLIGGGVIFVASQTGSNDSGDTATEAFETSDDSADASDADSAGESAAFDVAEEAMEEAAADESDMQAETEAADARADDSAMADQEVVPRPDADDEDAEEAESAPATTAVEGSTTTTATGGFFPQEPVMSYTSVPETDGLLTDLPAPRTDLAASRCGFEVDGRFNLEIVGYLPIEIAGESAEVFAVLTEDGSDSAIIVDETCEQLTPGN